MKSEGEHLFETISERELEKAKETTYNTFPNEVLEQFDLRFSPHSDIIAKISLILPANVKEQLG